ncbi:unnamed protein product, partial [Closterium sp. NIES-54]
MDVFEIEKEAGKARQAAAAASAAAASAAAAVEGDGAGLKDHFKPLNELPAAQRQKELHKEIQFVEHTWPLEQLYSHFHTDPAQGLSEVQVVVNRGRYGENRLTPGYVMPWWLRYLLQFTNFFSLLLIVAAALCFLAYGIDPAHDKENVSGDGGRKGSVWEGGEWDGRVRERCVVVGRRWGGWEGGRRWGSTEDGKTCWQFFRAPYG